MEMKVSKTSDPKKVAGAIASALRNGETATVSAVGPISVNQAVKSIIIARGYLATNGIDIDTEPRFTQIDIEGEGRTGIIFELKSK